MLSLREARREPPFVIGAALVLVALMGAVGHVLGADVGAAVDLAVDIAPVAAAAMAAALCASAAAVRSSGRAARLGWSLMAIAAGGWTIAWADIGGWVPVRAIAGLAAAAAVLTLLGGALGPATKLRVLVDGLLAAISLTFLAWRPVLSPLVESAGENQVSTLVLSAPVADILILSLLLAAGVRVSAEGRRVWVRLASAFVLLAAADGVVAYASIADLLRNPRVNQLLATGAALLVGAAARRGSHDLTPFAQDPRPPRPFAVLVPYAPFLIAGTETASQWASGVLDPALLRLGAVMVGLMIARQLVAQLETTMVSRQLDALLRDRTAQLHRQEQRLHSLVQHASELLTIVDGAGVIRYQSAASRRVLGRSPVELIDHSLVSLAHPTDRGELENALLTAPAPPADPTVIEVRFARADGSWVTTETTIADLSEDHGIAGVLLTTRDIDDRKHLEEQLRHDAFHDPLTGLGNRTLFHDRLAHTAARAARDPHDVAVLMIDLDGFKLVNDTLGHAAGDQLLCEVGNRLRRLVRPGDTVARMGGDEFAVLIEKPEPGVPEIVAERILAGLRAPVNIDGKSIVALGSVGVATASTQLMTPETLLRAADLAMYAAKVKGKGRYEVFEEDMQAVASLRMELENDLRRATRAGELVLHYQPIVELPSGRVAGVEALVRWNHPRRGMVPPSEFIPLAEDSDIVVEIGRWVLREAAATLQAWHGQYPASRPFYMSVNIAARQLLTPWLVEEVAKVLEQTGVEPSCLVLEITEGALMSDPAKIERTLADLRALGVRLAIDDFGTGWSSLSRLRSFPVDKLKIDRAFVKEIAVAHDPAPLVAATIAMGHSLGLELTAEGVETVEQLTCLHGLGCDEVQGFLLHRPAERTVIERLLADPSGMITGPEQLEPAPRPQAESDVVAAVTSSVEGNPAVPHTMLQALRRAAGLDVAYLTQVDEQAASQRVVDVSAGADSNTHLVGASLDWSASPCRQMVNGGPRLSSLPDEFPDHPFASAGGWHLSVPVHTPEGQLWGTLCGIVAERPDMPSSVVVLVNLFSNLVSRHLFGLTDADADADSSDGPFDEVAFDGRASGELSAIG